MSAAVRNRFADPRRLADCRNIDDLRRLARRRLPGPMFHYMEGGADDEWTLAENRRAFERYRLLPDGLVDVSQVRTATQVLGCELPAPFFIGPTGMSRLFHHEGEAAVTRAAAAAGTLYVLSTMGSTSIERVGQLSSGPKAYQIYAFKDRELTREFIQRARAAGYKALVLTVDVPVAGNRERDFRTGMTIPPRLGLMGLIDIARHPRWLYRHLTSPAMELANVSHRVGSGLTTLSEYIARQFDPGVTWAQVEWIAKEWGGPFAIKGLLSPGDARRAADSGATSVFVSNHGGRQLDGVPSPIEMLPAIAEAADGRLELILDGGVRRGTDIIKALIRGATACSLGRAYLYGLAAGGEAGVARALALLQDELVRGLALLGAPALTDLKPSHLLPLERRTS